MCNNKKLKVTILSGIPGSGKSTWARKEAFSDPKHTIIVNRDSIRESLGKYWVPERERLVTLLENWYIEAGLMEWYNVIIDSTNLNPFALKNLIEHIQNVRTEYEINVQIELKKFDISLNKAIWRDWLRGLKGGRKVGKKVITRFYERYIKNSTG